MKDVTRCVILGRCCGEPRGGAWRCDSHIKDRLGKAKLRTGMGLVIRDDQALAKYTRILLRKLNRTVQKKDFQDHLRLETNEVT